MRDTTVEHFAHVGAAFVAGLLAGWAVSSWLAGGREAAWMLAGAASLAAVCGTSYLVWRRAAGDPDTLQLERRVREALQTGQLRSAPRP